MLPALTGAAILSFIRGIENFESPLFFGSPAGIRVITTDIYDAINAVRQKADWATLKERVMTPARRQSTHAQHRKIMAALRARDAAGAAAEMTKHLQDVKRSIIGS